MKFKTMTIRQVEYHELEAHIRQVYGFEDPKELFSIIAMQEWRNDSQHLFCLNRKPLDKWQQRDLDKWKADPLGFHQYRLYAILQDMVNNGHLEEGFLLVTVCW